MPVRQGDSLAVDLDDAQRVVNPGALFQASRYTAMMLDPARDALTVIEIPRPMQ